MSKTQLYLGILNVFGSGLYFAFDHLFVSLILLGTGIWLLQQPAADKKDPPVIK